MINIYKLLVLDNLQATIKGAGPLARYTPTTFKTDPAGGILFSNEEITAGFSESGFLPHPHFTAAALNKHIERCLQEGFSLELKAI